MSTGINPLVNSLALAGGSFCPPTRLTPLMDHQLPQDPSLVALTDWRGQIGSHKHPSEDHHCSDGHRHHEHKMLCPQLGTAWYGGQREEGVSHWPWGPGSPRAQENRLPKSFFISSPNFGLMISVEQETRGRKFFS